MDNSEEVPLCQFGTPLEPLEEDDVPSKKPIAIEDQIVTDENGRRRFHGAFTGGFSAGFWNTVGSLEGWKPQSFKSSRSEKAEKRALQLPTDFMDDEDLGEFGIAPQRVQAREDFSKDDDKSNRKRKLFSSDNCAIPGTSVLQQLLEPSREKIAVRLLRRMGWKPGQGIGARQTRKEKYRSNERNNRELYVMKMYGCAMKSSNEPLSESVAVDISDQSEDDEQEEITFAPDDFEPFVCVIKDNTFGLGYTGLGGQSTSATKSHVNLFGPLEVMGKNNKKLSITGQAFGVGVLEVEDEDIYAKDDMSKYDFSLGNKKKNETQKLAGVQVQTVIEGFTEASCNSNVQKKVHRVELKMDFQPRNFSQRKTRFEPLSEEKITAIKQSEIHKKRGLGRHDLDPDERGNILDGLIGASVENKEDNKPDNKKKSYLQYISQKYKEKEDKSNKMLELLSSKADNFVKEGSINDASSETIISVEVSESVKSENQKVLSKAKDMTKSLGSSSETFRPFASDDAKQNRYDKFIQANLKQEEEIKTFLHSIQPINLSEWDREMERKEFIQARNIYKPLQGLMSERFVPKSNLNISQNASTTNYVEKVKITVERSKKMWKPCSCLCKRFNIPEPFGGTLLEPKAPKKNKFSVFDYIENSVNSKKDFVTPIIIPKHVEKSKEIHSQKEKSECAKIVPTKRSSSPGESAIPSTSNVVANEKAFALKTAAPKPISTRPKTELELRIEESRNKHPSEKKDLFKCIFDSSSDDETQDDPNTEDTFESVVPDEIVKNLIKPSAPINILKNNSPPRGIFASLLLKTPSKEESKEVNVDESLKLDKITFKPKHERQVQEDVPASDDIYGPKIPANFAAQSSTMLKPDDINKKLCELLSANPTKTTKVIEKWVEKRNKSSKKKKQERKEKKKKDRKEKVKKKHDKAKKRKK